MWTAALTSGHFALTLLASSFSPKEEGISIHIPDVMPEEELAQAVFRSLTVPFRFFDAALPDCGMWGYRALLLANSLIWGIVFAGLIAFPGRKDEH